MLRNLLFAFLAAFGVSAVLGEGPSLTNITATNPDLSILNTALGLTGLDDVLEFPNCHGIRCGRVRLFTVFAPTNAAFQALPDGVLTALTENLQNRVNRIVSDGTTRIGDLEFRLVELEGGDVSQLGETTTLGGDVGDGGQPDPTPSAPQGGEQVTELAIGEQADFDAARTALDAGNYQEAAVKFTVFTEAYPVGPLTGEAHFLRGEALSELGDTTNAARAYLESFSGAPDSPRAPEALFQLGVSLNKLGQFNEACISLGQVSVLYPGAAVAEDASATAREIGCG